MKPMKKVVSIVLIAALVLSCMSAGIVLTAAEGEVHRTGFYYDFSSKESHDMLADVAENSTRTYLYKPMYIPGGAKSVYDTANEAALVTPYATNSQGVNPFLWLGCALDEYTADMTTNTVLAMKVKLTNPATSKLGSVKMLVHGTAMSRFGLSERSTEMTLPNVPTFENTTDWQLVLIDLSSDNYTDQMRAIAEESAVFGSTASWFMTMIEFTTLGDTSPIYVEWAGVFKDEEVAVANYAATTPSYTPTPELSPSSYHMDLSTQERYTYFDTWASGANRHIINGNLFNTLGKTTTVDSWDGAVGAVKLQGNGTDTVDFDFRSYGMRNGMDVNRYSVFALKVKLPDTNATFTDAKMGIALDGNVDVSADYALNAIPTYEKTTDWQLVLIDLSSTNWGDELVAKVASASATVWYGGRLKLAQTGYAGAIHVQWAGFFATKADAETYYHGQSGFLTDSSMENLGTQLRQSDKALRFGFRIHAGKVGYQLGSYAEAVNQNYFMRNDLVKSEATMIIDGEERSITDFGAIVTVKENTVASDLTAENVKVAGSGIKAISGRKLYMVSGNRIDYVVTITNANEYASKPIYARIYVAYKDANNTTKYVYGDMVSQMVNTLQAGDFVVTPSKTIEQSAAAVTNQNATTYSIQNDYTQITQYDSAYGYVHHPGLAVFKGKLYASFSRGLVYEDTPGQHVVVTSADLDKTTDPSAWSPLKTVAKSKAGDAAGLCISGYLFVSGDRLYCYYMDKKMSDAWMEKHASEPDDVKYEKKSSGDADYSEFYPNNIVSNGSYFVYTTDGVNWSEPKIAGYATNESPRQSITGQWFTGSGNQLLYSDKETPSVRDWSYVGRYVGMTGAQIAEMDNADGLGSYRRSLTEASWYQTDDKVIHHMLRCYNGYVWMSESYDNGKTFTVPYSTNFTSDSTMAKFGRLTNEVGTGLYNYYFVGNPSNTNMGSRDPLALYTSADGYHFDRKYVLRQTSANSYQVQNYNWSKAGAYAYPEALIEGDYMYIIHSEYKEIMSITRVKVSDLQVEADPMKYLSESRWHFDFTEETELDTAKTWVSPDRHAINGNMFSSLDATTTIASWDSTQAALKLEGNGTDPLVLDIRSFDRRTGMSVSKYTKLALQIKIPDGGAALQSVKVGLAGTETGVDAKVNYTLNAIPAYDATTGWQTIVVDLSKTNWSKATTDAVAAYTAAGEDTLWWATRLELAQAGYTGPVYVKWIGIFEEK